jgi:hypothetical protein
VRGLTVIIAVKVSPLKNIEANETHLALCITVFFISMHTEDT